jgi:atrazine chlorohydrolase/5-methylthioadenosine/S-adenosylhomocysteine deaminase/melamine deaminase
MAPCHSVASALVYQAYGNEVDTVLVDGRVLMRDRRLSFLDDAEEQALVADAQQASEGIVERAGMGRIRDRGWRSLAGA